MHPSLIVTNELMLDGGGKEKSKNVKLLALSLGICKKIKIKAAHLADAS